MAIDRNCVGINGKKLRQARIEAGFKIKDLCKKTGLSESSISLIENEKISAGIRTIRLLADSLCVSIDWLCDLSVPGKDDIVNLYNELGTRDQEVLLGVAKLLTGQK